MESMIITNPGDKSFYLLCAYLSFVVFMYMLSVAIVQQKKLQKLVELKRMIKEGSSDNDRPAATRKG